MLDSDASFSLVPEFHTIRRAPTKGLARSSDLPFCAESFAACTDAASFVPVPRDPAPGHPAAEEPVALAPTPAETPLTRQAPEDTDTTTPDARAITPRRPLRFTPARDGGDHAPVTLPVLNLFANVFDDDSLHGPGIDPRLQRGRDRARACLAAHQADLPPEARNLWHDMDIDDAAEPAAPETGFTVTETECPATASHPRRRIVRHLTPRSNLSTPPQAPAELDPLQEQLHLIRDALYAEDPAGAEAPPQPHRAAALWQALVAVFLPLFTLLAPRAAALRDRLAPPRAFLLPPLAQRAVAGCAMLAMIGLSLSSAIL